MYFYSPEEREAKTLFPGISARTFWGEHMLMAVVDLAPDALVPSHSHPHEQTGFVVSGEAEFTVGGQTRLLKPGDIYIIPGGVEHHVQTGPDGARCIDIFSPVREEYKY